MYKYLRKKKIYNLESESKIKGKTSIYVVRLMKTKGTLFDNILGNSKPCDRCQRFLYMHNIKTIKYTDIINGKNYLCKMVKI